MKFVEEFFAGRSVQLRLTHLKTLPELREYLSQHQVQCACLSTALEATEQLDALTAFSASAKKTGVLFPLIYSVDWRNPVQQLLGTQWAGQIGILHAQSSAAEVRALFTRLLASN